MYDSLALAAFGPPPKLLRGENYDLQDEEEVLFSDSAAVVSGPLSGSGLPPSNYFPPDSQLFIKRPPQPKRLVSNQDPKWAAKPQQIAIVDTVQRPSNSRYGLKTSHEHQRPKTRRLLQETLPAFVDTVRPTLQVPDSRRHFQEDGKQIAKSLKGFRQPKVQDFLSYNEM